MPDSSNTEPAATLQGPFNLAAIMETKAQQALGKAFGGDGCRLANRLAVAKSLKRVSKSVLLGQLKDIGDISQTKTFADCRSKLMAAFPDLKDVRFKTTEPGCGYEAFAFVDLCLKDPAPALRR